MREDGLDTGLKQKVILHHRNKQAADNTGDVQIAR